MSDQTDSVFVIVHTDISCRLSTRDKTGKNQASHYFGPVLSADAAKRQRWLDKVQKLAAR